MPRTWLLHFATSYLTIPEGQARDLEIRDADGWYMRSHEWIGPFGGGGLELLLMIDSARSV